MHFSEDYASRSADPVRKSSAAAIRSTGWQELIRSSYNPTILLCNSTANGFSRTAHRSRNPKLAAGALRTARDVKSRGLSVRGRPAPRIWPHQTFSCGITSSPRCRPRRLECLRDVVKSAVCACRRPCAALRRRPLCATLNYETVVTGHIDHVYGAPN